MVRQLLEELTWCGLLNVRRFLELLLMVWCFKDNESRLTSYFKKYMKGDVAEVAVHQYARCYILALLADTIFADKSGDRVHTMWL